MRQAAFMPPSALLSSSLQIQLQARQWIWKDDRLSGSIGQIPASTSSAIGFKR
ncbi:MAG: hypothetical protein ACKO8Z_15440 [Prosthecobacter sp.]